MIQTIQSLSKVTSPGPSPVYTPVHVSRALLIIGDEGPVGRVELSRKLGLGEGAARTIIRHLVKAKVVTIATEGCRLTPSGLTLYRSLRLKLSEARVINARQLALDKSSVAVLVKGGAKLVKRGIEQRDAAVRAGATGACTLVFKDGKLRMPMGQEEEGALDSNDPLFQEIEQVFAPRDNDVIAIASAPTQQVAEHCVVAAALTLVP